ncbi:MAG: hypothetical protein H7A21_00580 [Spirochaetales bacterium]|nr:hypothetical protein [Leptospiraceae bacterium]MCP5479905.1 hypothetical protein [Spirochaetales bacterium]MCP5486660.1 hypothetical protein [Spirochaetales bacterium]
MVRRFLQPVVPVALCLCLVSVAGCGARDPIAATFHRMRQAAVGTGDPVIVRWADFELRLGEIGFAGEHGRVHEAEEINQLPPMARRALLERIALRKYFVREALSGEELDRPAAARFLLARFEQAVEEYHLMQRFREPAGRSLEGALPAGASQLEQSMVRQRARVLRQRYQARLLQEFGPVQISETRGDL